MAINLIDKVKPKGNFSLVDSEDVEMSDGTKLDEFYENVKENLPKKIVSVTELPESPEEDVVYLVVESS